MYPPCATVKPKAASPYEVARTVSIDLSWCRWGKATETPPDECVPKLQAAKDAGAPVEWHAFRNATHCWDCEHLNRFSKKDVRGTSVTYRYDAGATQETKRRIFEFLERTWAAGR